MKITYEQYDILEKELIKIPNKLNTWLPTIDDLNTYVEPNSDKYVEFLLWLTLTVNTDKSSEGKQQLRAINKTLYEKILLIE